jgi:hypothetical protein
MFDKLLPQPIDNEYRGYEVALWLFTFVVGVRQEAYPRVSILSSRYSACSTTALPETGGRKEPPAKRRRQ